MYETRNEVRCGSDSTELCPASGPHIYSPGGQELYYWFLMFSGYTPGLMVKGKVDHHNRPLLAHERVHSFQSVLASMI